MNIYIRPAGGIIAMLPQWFTIISRGNRTPGSRVATGCNSLDAQRSSFQLTHMSREDHAQSSIESAMASKSKTSAY